MYVKITNGNVDTYPYSVGQLRRDNPNTSFPKQISTDMLESYGVYPVTQAEQPSYTPRTQNSAKESTPSLVGGVWTLGWTVSAKTSEETTEYDNTIAGVNRDKRNTLLSETDWTGMSDVTMTSGMTTYRQALRDITAHDNWPNLEDADWPTKP
jgi:hypothetical protein